jgi:hypothetical protein
MLRAPFDSGTDVSARRPSGDRANSVFGAGSPTVPTMGDGAVFAVELQTRGKSETGAHDRSGPRGAELITEPDEERAGGKESRGEKPGSSPTA